VFTWYEGFKSLNNVVKVSYPAALQTTTLEQLKGNPQWNERSDEIVIIANNKVSNHEASIYKLRVMLADGLHARGFKVSWYGHTKLPKPYYKGKADGKDVLKNVRFSICSENTYDEAFSKNYLTEKLPHVISKGAFPIYMGCHNIDDFNMQGSMIDLRSFVTKKGRDISNDFDYLTHVLKTFNKEFYDEYRQNMYAQKGQADGLFWRFSHQRAYQMMLASLG